MSTNATITGNRNQKAYLYIIIAVAVVIGLSSCAKKGTECTNTTSGVTNVITVADGKAESCVGAVCADAPLGTLSEADYIKALEAAGYTCK